MPVDEKSTEGDGQYSDRCSLSNEARGQSVPSPAPACMPSGSPQFQPAGAQPAATPPQIICSLANTLFHLPLSSLHRQINLQPPQHSVPPPTFIPAAPRARSGTPGHPPQPNMITKPTFAEQNVYDFNGDTYDFSEAALFLGVPQTVAARAQEFHKFARGSAMMDAGAARYGYEAALVAWARSLTRTVPWAWPIQRLELRVLDVALQGRRRHYHWPLEGSTTLHHWLSSRKHSRTSSCNDEREVSTALSDPLDCFSDPLDISKDGIKWVKAEISRQISIEAVANVAEKFPEDSTSGSSRVLDGQDIRRTCCSLVDFIPQSIKESREFDSEGDRIMMRVEGTYHVHQKGFLMIRQAKLVTSDTPVLEGAPPAEDSVHTAGRRLFANGKSDRQGAPRQKPSVAVTKIKGKGKVSTRQTSHHPAISLSDDESAEELDTVAPPARPIGPPPPPGSFKVVKLPTSQKKVEKKVPKKASNKEVISLLSSDGRSGSECPEEDGVSNGHSDYEDESSSKKRKARSDGTSRASKKRPSPSDATTEKADLPKSVKSKGKGKGSAERRGSPVIAESSDEETVPEQGRAKRLRDGPSSKPVSVPKSRPVVKKPLAGDTNSPNDSAVKGGATEAPARSSPPSSPSLTHHSVPVHANPAPPTLSAKPQSASVQPLTTEVPPTLPTAEVPPTLAAHHGRRPEADGMVISQDGDPNEHRLMVRPHDANLRPGNFQADPRMYAPRQRLPMQPRYPSPQWNDPPHGENHPQGPGRAFTRYPPSEYIRNYHDSRMPHAPQPSGRTQPHTVLPHMVLSFPCSMVKMNTRQDRVTLATAGITRLPTTTLAMVLMDIVRILAPTEQSVLRCWGMYQDGYGREYPNDSDNGGRAP
ncbi:hypothetical protein BDR07DRAFT_1483838 [Suillus spraguei]|nr:hypothetical protein BDR07DRAFT_1483838 [Suillus spraguei]